MPIIIALKEPGIHMIVKGDIKDTPEVRKEYDEIFPNFFCTDEDGHNIVIPLDRNCNIAFIKETTEEEIRNQRQEAEKRRQERERMGGGQGLVQPRMVFPGTKGRGRA